MIENRDVDGVVTMLLQFLHTLSDWAGEVIARAIHAILPSVVVPASLASSIGLLAVVSILLGLAEVAKKAVWVVVVAGWALVFIRIGLIVFS